MIGYKKFTEHNFDQINFQTGDLILFSADHGFLTACIKLCSHSKFSHIGMVIRDPNFLPDDLKVGIYLLESTSLETTVDIEDHKKKIGVQIQDLRTVLENYPGKTYYRRLMCNRDAEFMTRLSYAHSLVHNEPYDFEPIDWIDLAFHTHYGNLHREDEFVCSALVAFMYVSLGILNKNTNWTVYRPCDFGTENLSDRNYLYFTSPGGYLDSDVYQITF